MSSSILGWIEVLAVILYTGPLFVLYNGILCGFGNFGHVGEAVLFWSSDVAKQINPRTVKETLMQLSIGLHPKSTVS